MDKCVEIGGKTYVSSRRAAAETDYTQDYVGQLARSGEIEARRLAGRWYVDLDSIKQHKEQADAYEPQPPQVQKGGNNTNPESVVMFDGREYVASSRAAALTGYSQDYIGQLARESTVASRQVGNRWYVAKGELMKHKREADAQLAAVQADATGYTEGRARVQRPAVSRNDGHSYAYTSDTRDLMPRLKTQEADKTHDVAINRISDSRDIGNIGRNDVSRVAEMTSSSVHAETKYIQPRDTHVPTTQKGGGSLTNALVAILIPLLLFGGVAFAYFVVFSQGIIEYQRSQAR